MRAPYTQLYLHLIWSTWDRLPLITEMIEKRLYAAMAVNANLNVTVSNFVVADHVHMLIRLHPTISVATLAKEIKGATSHLITHEIIPDQFFKWQGSYRAFTIRKSEVPQVKAYIENQKQHHTELQLQTECEPGIEIAESDDVTYGG
jgi:REP element-mobilizing transposase RayT